MGWGGKGSGREGRGDPGKKRSNNIELSRGGSVASARVINVTCRSFSRYVYPKIISKTEMTFLVFTDFKSDQKL